MNHGLLFQFLRGWVVKVADIQGETAKNAVQFPPSVPDNDTAGDLLSATQTIFKFFHAYPSFPGPDFLQKNNLNYIPSPRRMQQERAVTGALQRRYFPCYAGCGIPAKPQ